MVDLVRFVPLLPAAVNLYIFAYVQGQRKNSNVNRGFLILTGFLITLCLCEFLMRQPFPLPALLTASRLALCFLVLTPISFLYFIYAVVLKPLNKTFYIFLAISCAASLLSFALPHHQMVTGVRAASAVIAPTVIFIPLYLASSSAVYYCLFLLRKASRTMPSRMARNQCNYLFWSTILCLLLAFLVLVVIPFLFKAYVVLRFASLINIVYSVLMYLAITKYGLMLVDLDQIQKTFSVLFSTVSEAAVVTDRNGIVMQMNSIAQELFPDLTCSKPVTALSSQFPDLDLTRPMTNQKRFTAAGGEEKVVIISNSSIESNTDELGQLILARDISKEQKLEEAIGRKNQIESLGRLAGGIAHDFNNQLAGILGCADMLRTSLNDNASLYELADIIVQSSQRSSRLTQQMLAFARKGKYQVVTLNIHDIIAEVVAMLEHSIDKKIKILQHLGAQAPLVKGDASQLHNVFLNISLNSRDAMPEGGELVFQTEDITVDNNSALVSQFDLAKGRFVMVSVQDNGTGMKKSDLARAFEPFFTTKKDGSGMGLAAAYGTIRSHTGAIAIESEEGIGTTVSMYLPVTSETGMVKNVAFAQPVQKSQLTILLIEDEAVVARTMTMILERAGNRVIACETGQKAIDQYQDHWQEIDLIILDIILPDITGYETFKALKTINPKLRVLLSSGYSIAGEAKKILDEGAADFIQKPYSASVLMQKIAAIIS